MNHQILQMLSQGNAQAVQNYVRNNLPSDQAGLERIYNELVAHDLKTDRDNKKKQAKTQRSLSVKTLSKTHRVRPEDKQVYQTERMIKKLKEKGLKAVVGTEEQGIAVYQKTREKVIKPLIANTKLLKSQQAPIDRLIERYSVNERFYKNDIEDVNLNTEEVIDRDMKQFLVRRQNVLDSISGSQPTVGFDQPNIPTRYKAVESKLTDIPVKKVSFQAQPRLRKSFTTKRRLSVNNHLMQECAQSLKKKESQSVPTENMYLDLQQRLQDGGMTQVDVKAIFVFKKLRENMAKEQYDRYTHTYMNMLASKANNCKLNKHAKDLIQDARKMRNIIDFSKQ